MIEIQGRDTCVKGLVWGGFNAHEDHRGNFIKLFNNDFYKEKLSHFCPEEIFMSSSVKGVLRGMHYQIGEFAHNKLVICLSGTIRDVVVDLRPGENFGAVWSSILVPEETQWVYVPVGCAHGFQVLSDVATMLYCVDRVYSLSHDKGVLWDSIDFKWDILPPILSDRDSSHLPLNEHRGAF